MDFGFTISKTRAIRLDDVDAEKTARVSELRRCMECGGCTATCSAGLFSDFSPHRTHLLFRRGQYEGLAEALDKCMLCGKCTLVCPRGVNLRRAILNMRTLLK